MECACLCAEVKQQESFFIIIIFLQGVFLTTCRANLVWSVLVLPLLLAALSHWNVCHVVSARFCSLLSGGR